MDFLESLLHILVDRRHRIHQALKGKGRQLAMTKRRYLRLRQPKHLGRIHLRELYQKGTHMFMAVLPNCWMTGNAECIRLITTPQRGVGYTSFF